MAVSSGRTVRILGIAAACGVSIVAGLGLVFQLVTPALLPILATHELMGLLALLVLPAVALVALRVHRRGIGPGFADGTGSMPHASASVAVGAEGGLQQIVVLAPDLRNRSPRRHRRRVVHGRVRVKV